jgi:excisionase family DNA binding protein
MTNTSVGKLRSKPETAKQLSISIATLDRLIAAGRIEYFKIGWHVRFSDEQINAYLENARNAPRQRHSARRKATRQRARKAA